MRNSQLTQLPLEQIDELCRRSGVQTLWLFGSALENLSAANDVDLLVEYEPHMQVSLLGRTGWICRTSSLSFWAVQYT